MEFSTNGFKCRVDDKNKLNVFYQNTFYFDDYYYDENKMLELAYNCSKLFYSNNYKIVGIESSNGGGLVTLPIYLK